MSEAKISCVICGCDIGDEGMSQFAAYGGLPSPCCKVCFEVNDYSIKSHQQLLERSLIRRATDPEFLKRLGIKPPEEGVEVPKKGNCHD